MSAQKTLAAHTAAQIRQPDLADKQQNRQKKMCAFGQLDHNSHNNTRWPMVPRFSAMSERMLFGFGESRDMELCQFELDECFSRNDLLKSFASPIKGLICAYSTFAFAILLLHYFQNDPVLLKVFLGVGGARRRAAVGGIQGWAACIEVTVAREVGNFVGINIRE